MNSPKPRESHQDEYVNAPVPVPRQKRSWLRRNWLTGAFVCTLGAVATVTVMNFMETEREIQLVRAEKTALQAKLEETRRKSDDLNEQQRRMAGDEYMEMMARRYGFVNANETVFQKGPAKSN